MIAVSHASLVSNTGFIVLFLPGNLRCVRLRMEPQRAPGFVQASIPASRRNRLRKFFAFRSESVANRQVPSVSTTM